NPRTGPATRNKSAQAAKETHLVLVRAPLDRACRATSPATVLAIELSADKTILSSLGGTRPASLSQGISSAAVFRRHSPRPWRRWRFEGEGGYVPALEFACPKLLRP